MALQSPFAVPAVRRFIAFRVFFNARFYYPVFTVLFLDFGLTLSQFAVLNAVWAASIVLCEVPSGALADIIGRRRLLVAAGIMMVLEIGLLCFVPLGNIQLLFAVFVANRLLSGTAEAAASGADEALAYDALVQAGLQDDWGRVLERQVRLQSAAFVVTMSVGAAVYDPQLLSQTARFLGLDLNFDRSLTLRLPLYLTLLSAIATLLTALRMEERSVRREEIYPSVKGWVQPIRAAFALTLRAGAWILQTPFALVTIASGLLFDHVLRMVITLSSQYYRVIQIPEAAFGLIGSALALLGFIVPRLARRLAAKRTAGFNLGLMAVATLTTLWGLSLCRPLWGLLPMALLVSVMYLNGFFQSHYLNQVTASHQRATVLSFKGLCFNLGYGAIGIAYSLLLAMLSKDFPAGQVALEDRVFEASLAWFPGYFLIMLGLLLAFARWRLGAVPGGGPRSPAAGGSR